MSYVLHGYAEWVKSAITIMGYVLHGYAECVWGGGKSTLITGYVL